LLVAARFSSAAWSTWRGDGRTIIISSHQIAEVERVASPLAFMSGATFC